MNLLLEPISKEVENYYKEPKLWYRGSEKILEIKQIKRTIFLCNCSNSNF